LESIITNFAIIQK